MGARVDVHGWTLAARRAGTHSLALWPPLALAFLVVVSVRDHALSLDLVNAYLPAAHAVLAGRSPFPGATSQTLMEGSAFVYPPLTAWLVVPFTVLPLAVAEALGFVLSIACVVGVLLVLGVRDWRCVMVTFLWVPTFSEIQTANVGVLLLLGLGGLWRFRHHAVVAGIILGFMVALKLYYWPLAVVFLGARRFRTVWIAAATAIVATAASWAPIGFAGLRTYPHLLAVLTRIERNGYEISGVLAPAVSWRLATLVVSAIGLAVLAGAWRRAYLGDERRAFVAAIAAVLVLSPIIHMNYFVVLIVVIALFKPTFGWLWLLPLALWLGPQVNVQDPWQRWAVLAVVAATMLAAVHPDPQRLAAAEVVAPKRTTGYDAAAV